MANVYVCSDLHLGHENIGNFRSPDMGFPRGFYSDQVHRQWLMNWLGRINKRDILICLGDIAFTEEALEWFHNKVTCRKWLVKGNHCINSPALEAKVYERVEGLLKYKKMWLSHAPIHPLELRGKINLHGHVHYATIPDDRYFNCCPENLMGVFGSPIAKFDDIKEEIDSEE